MPWKKKNLRDIRTLEHVFDVQYEKQVLVVRCTDAKHNLIRLLNYLQSQDISFGRVFSELPTLNDVFSGDHRKTAERLGGMGDVAFTEIQFSFQDPEF